MPAPLIYKLLGVTHGFSILGLEAEAERSMVSAVSCHRYTCQHELLAQVSMATGDGGRRGAEVSPEVSRPPEVDLGLRRLEGLPSCGPRLRVNSLCTE